MLLPALVDLQHTLVMVIVMTTTTMQHVVGMKVTVVGLIINTIIVQTVSASTVLILSRQVASLAISLDLVVRQIMWVMDSAMTTTTMPVVTGTKEIVAELLVNQSNLIIVPTVLALTCVQTKPKVNVLTS
jgi:hypothetical protein